MLREVVKKVITKYKEAWKRMGAWLSVQTRNLQRELSIGEAGAVSTIEYGIYDGALRRYNELNLMKQSKGGTIKYKMCWEILDKWLRNYYQTERTIEPHTSEENINKRLLAQKSLAQIIRTMQNM